MRNRKAASFGLPYAGPELTRARRVPPPLCYAAICASCFGFGCGSDSGPRASGATGGLDRTSGGRVAADGGASTTGGAGSPAVSGGSATTGGTPSGGNRTSGGTAPAGGNSAYGGTSLTGGSPASGGRNSGGSTATGGAPSSGGKAAVGGNVNSGGSAATGGAPSSGGKAAVGGNVNSGGSAATGGAPSSGGKAAVGGNVNSGGSAATGGASGGSTHTGPWKIMMLGDSITATTCYPQLLWKDLTDAGHTGFTFVGSVYNNQGCGLSFPTSQGFPTEGHSGELAVNDAATTATWFGNNPPDIVVMHFGTNDVWGNGGAATATNVIDAYSTILANLRSVNPSAIMFVARIIPLNPSQCSPTNPCNYEATLDAQIPAWASSHSTAASPILAVDLESIFLDPLTFYPNSSYTSDGAHPNQAGSQKMADTMSLAIIAQGYF